MRNLKKLWVLLLLLLAIAGPLSSQSAYSKFKMKSFKHKKYNSNLQIEPRLYYGFIINHHTELAPFNSHVPAFEISLIKDTYGKKEWEKIHNYPYVGVSLFYSTLSDHPAIGQVVAVYPFVTFPILRNKNNFIGFKMGLGLGYLTKKFDPLTNYKNIAIGSHVNVAINLMAEYRKQLSKRTALTAGISLIHYSNGSTATPNYGLNLPMISVGMSHRLSEPNSKIALRKATIPPWSYKPNKIYVFNIMAGYATKNMGNVFGERFDVYMASVNALKKINEISAIGVSFDFSYDGSHKAMLEQKGIIDPSFITVMRPGIAPTYEFRMSRLIIGLGVGFYWGGKEKSEGDIYEQLTLKVLAYKNTFVMISLRAHGARAAFVSYGLGYRLEYDWGKK